MYSQAGGCGLTPYKKSDIGTGYSAEVLVSVPVMHRGGVKSTQARGAPGGVAAGLKCMSISASERGKLELETFEALEREVHGVLCARLIEQVALLAVLPGTLGGDLPAPVRGAAFAVTMRICKL